MNFEDFWAQLSPPEQRIMPQYFARYIWNTAQTAAYCRTADQEKKAFDNKVGDVKTLMLDPRQMDLL
jgi:hypothetical protein